MPNTNTGAMTADPDRSLGDRLVARTEYRFGLLLGLLLATFVVLMIGSSSKWVRPISVALTGTTLVAALFAAEVGRHVRRIAMALAVLAVIAALSVVSLGRSGDGAAALLNAALVCVAPVAIARSTLRRGVTDLQTVMAALCIYVIIGMLWAFTYTAIGSFGSDPFFAQQPATTTADYLYFSFITQTTV